MRTKQISQEALAVLSGCRIEDSKAEAAVFLPAGMLDRKLYQEVDLVLREIGGKWSRGAKAHLYADTAEHVRERFDGVILSGEIQPASMNGFFPTPPDLALQVAAMTIRDRVSTLDRYLEPSCGNGSLIRALCQIGANPRRILGLELVDRHACAAREATDNGVRILNADFMDNAWGIHEMQFERILMNPPFERLQDARHILRAWEFLAPGGRLVAISSAGIRFRRESLPAAVRSLVSDQGGEIQDLPAGAFKESGTMVSTCVIRIDKPEF